MLVVQAHLWADHVSWSGIYAVFGFYMLSGYLIALILTEKYHRPVVGTACFFLNRALRIYPPYLLVLGIAVVLVRAMPTLSHELSPPLVWPAGLADWFENVFIFGIHDEVDSRLVPPSWSLGIELGFYLAMGLGLARNKWVAAVWWVASVGATVWMMWHQTPFGVRYGSFVGGSLPFSTGVMLYHFRKYFRFVRPSQALVAICVWLVNLFFARKIWPDPLFHGMYASVVLMAWVLCALAAIDRQSGPLILRRVDKVLGHLSYPIFLCHAHVSVIVVAALYAGERPGGTAFWLTSLPAIHLVSWAVHLASEEPVAAVRSKVRNRAV